VELICAIDLLDQKVVRLSQGRYDQVTVYANDPVREARRFAALGARRLHVVDLDGARSGTPVHTEVVRRIVASTELEVQVGGGIRSPDAAEAWLKEGVRRVVLGTAALRAPAAVEALAHDHPGRVIVAVDARDGIVATDGWTQSSGVAVAELAARVDAWGVDGILFTDIARDGMRTGPAVDTTAALQRAVRAEVIASGGIGSLDDLVRLAEAGVRAAVAGRALYEGSLSIPDAMRLRKSA
jgi:phosphoribosylformimino-5-aminoimidazole carboxamide ribotide isomerase